MISLADGGHEWPRGHPEEVADIFRLWRQCPRHRVRPCLACSFDAAPCLGMVVVDRFTFFGALLQRFLCYRSRRRPGSRRKPGSSKAKGSRKSKGNKKRSKRDRRYGEGMDRLTAAAAAAQRGASPVESLKIRPPPGSAVRGRRGGRDYHEASGVAKPTAVRFFCGEGMGGLSCLSSRLLS